MDKEDVVHIHRGILLNHKKNESMPFAAIWMDVEIIILSKREKKILYDVTYMWNLKYDTNELSYKTERRLTDTGNRLVVAKTEGGLGKEWIGSLGLAGANCCI